MDFPQPGQASADQLTIDGLVAYAGAQGASDLFVKAGAPRPRSSATGGSSKPGFLFSRKRIPADSPTST